jgi:hypothetical protein
VLSFIPVVQSARDAPIFPSDVLTELNFGCRARPHSPSIQQPLVLQKWSFATSVPALNGV